MTTNFECVALALLSQINQGIQLVAQAVLAEPNSDARVNMAERLVELQKLTIPATKAVTEFINRHTEDTDQLSKSMIARTAGASN